MKERNIQEQNEQIIHRYKEDEEKMVLIFLQWCVNEGLDPFLLYEKAYPNQPKNELLEQLYEETIPKEEALEVTDDVLLQVLDIFGNHDLAIVAMEAKQKKKK